MNYKTINTCFETQILLSVSRNLKDLHLYLQHADENSLFNSTLTLKDLRLDVQVHLEGLKSSVKALLRRVPNMSGHKKNFMLRTFLSCSHPSVSCISDLLSFSALILRGYTVHKLPQL